jgi:hypothetical protein
MTEGNYSNVGHRGPVCKGLGAMNPCDNLYCYDIHLHGLQHADSFSFTNLRPVTILIYVDHTLVSDLTLAFTATRSRHSPSVQTSGCEHC